MPLTGNHNQGDNTHIADHDTIDNDIAALQNSVAGKAATAHSHIESDVTSLVADLAAKAAASHTHAESDVTGLTNDLSMKSPQGHTHLEGDISSLTGDLASKAAATHTHAGLSVIPGIFGDGSDGLAVLDGVNSYSWATYSSSTYTLSRDVFCTDLTINSGITLDMAGRTLNCTGTLTNNGTIKRKALDASGFTGGTSTEQQTWGSGGQTGYSGTTGAGTAPAAVSTLGGQGGNGGSGAGGAGGTTSAPLAFNGYPITRGFLGILANVTNLIGEFSGLAGGAGAGDGATNKGGGGGGGGGDLFISANLIQGVGSITAVGGAGGTPSAGNCGGGGGGGGGTIIVISNSISSGSVPGQSFNVSGGLGGTKSGTGTNGANGHAGTVVLLPAVGTPNPPSAVGDRLTLFQTVSLTANTPLNPTWTGAGVTVKEQVGTSIQQSGGNVVLMTAGTYAIQMHVDDLAAGESMFLTVADANSPVWQVGNYGVGMGTTHIFSVAGTWSMSSSEIPDIITSQIMSSATGSHRLYLEITRVA